MQYISRPADIDTKTLREIAAVTEGNFYSANNTAQLKQIYHDIDQLEKTKMSVTRYAKWYEVYQPFAIAAVLILLLEILLRLTVFRRIP